MYSSTQNKKRMRRLQIMTSVRRSKLGTRTGTKPITTCLSGAGPGVTFRRSPGFTGQALHSLKSVDRLAFDATPAIWAGHTGAVGKRCLIASRRSVPVRYCRPMQCFPQLGFLDPHLEFLFLWHVRRFGPGSLQTRCPDADAPKAIRNRAAHGTAGKGSASSVASSLIEGRLFSGNTR